MIIVIVSFKSGCVNNMFESCLYVFIINVLDLWLRVCNCYVDI